MSEHDLDAIALTTLNEAQLAALGRCPFTTSRLYRDGEELFKAGDRECKFDVVKSGEVEIRDDSAEPSTTIVVLRPGQFTGDVAHLAASPALVTCVARGGCEVFEVSYRNSLRAMRELAGYQRLALERKRADYRDKVDAAAPSGMSVVDPCAPGLSPRRSRRS